MFKVGEVLEEFKTGKDLLAIAVTEDVITLYVGYANPTEEELHAIQHNRLDLHLAKKDDAIIFSFKSYRGNDGDYFETYYNPNVTPPLRFHKFDEAGYGLMIIILDSATGIVKGIRFQMCSVEFSNKLVEMVTEEQKKRFFFDLMSYYRNVEKIMKRYDSKEIFERNTNIIQSFESGITTDTVIFAGDL